MEGRGNLSCKVADEVSYIIFHRNDNKKRPLYCNKRDQKLFLDRFHSKLICPDNFVTIHEPSLQFTKFVTKNDFWKKRDQNVQIGLLESKTLKIIHFGYLA